MDPTTGKVVQGIEMCLINDHYGFASSLNAIYENEDTSKLP